ncbi:MAG: hypothetical protein ACPIOQ_07970 [Promethearchaeia archaeon]
MITGNEPVLDLVHRPNPGPGAACRPWGASFSFSLSCVLQAPLRPLTSGMC